MKRSPDQLDLVTKAVFRQRWTALGVQAQIHAVTGAHGANLVNLAGRLFYVALGAAAAANIDAEDIDMRVIRGAVNAMEHAAAAAEPSSQDKAGISSGLEAVQRISARVPLDLLVLTHFEMIGRLNAGGVRSNTIAPRGAATTRGETR